MTTEPASKPQMDVLVISHNHLELLIRCLDRLKRVTPTPYHLIIVDDSTDLTPLWLTNYLRENRDVTCIHSDVAYKNGNQIFNRALQHCRTPYMATVMNSVTVEPGWEVGPLQVLAADAQVGVVGMKCLLPSGVIESAGIKMLKWLPTDIGRGEPAHRHALTYHADAVQWAFAMVRVAAAKGNLDEDTFFGFRGWDDIDNCFALKRAGWKVMQCGASVGYHEPRATRGDNSQQASEENKANGHNFIKRIGMWEEFVKEVPDLNPHAPPKGVMVEA